MKTPSNVVLAIYPNTRGFGFACIEWPQKILDSGIVTVRPLLNGKLLERAKKLMDYYRPSLVILRDCSIPFACRAKRTQVLLADIESSAKEIGLPVRYYSRQQTKDVFEQFGARTKHEISQKIIEWFPSLNWRAPKPRKAWMEEDYHMGVFDAIAIAVTDRYLTE